MHKNRISMTTVKLVQGANAILGEGPLWCERSASLYWIDIKRTALYRYTPGHGQTGFWLLPELAGCVAGVDDGRLLVALKSGLHLFDPAHGTLERLADAAHARPSLRYNDGAVDARGRFWVGTMADDGDGPGDLHCFEHARASRVAVAGFACANGMGWSPDGATMYVTDSGRRTIFAYAFDVAAGQLSSARPFATFGDARGVPDGLAVDAEGGVWSAIWDGWRLHRYAPDGALDRVVEMPVQRPTSVAFGGADRATLFVTSASVNVSADGLLRGPLAGSLFETRPGVAGLEQHCVARAWLGDAVAATPR